ncbi:GEVED domain-containing protein [Aquimarina muelleri]|uniref:GEVED domain-containing protein n=1 Tax=Aquimarina muelleri TaxID=279356 RepID=UPI003F688FBF
MKKSYRSLSSILGFPKQAKPKLNTLIISAMVFLSGGIYAQTPQQKAQILQQSNLSELNQLQTTFTNQAKLQKEEAIQIAKRNGWQVKMNTANGGFAELQRVITVDNKTIPIYYSTSNVAAAKSTRANHLHTGGSLSLNLNGQNMTAYVWDGGATRTTHQEFDGAGGNNRVTINDGVTTLNSNSFHAQHVTGTIVASGVQANAKGMAPQAKAKTSDWNNDSAEVTSAASNGMLLSNHSYGFAARDQNGNPQLPTYYFGGYIDESRQWDQIMHNAPYYLMVVAAGNDGNDNSVNGAPLNGNSSYDKLTGHSTSKNNLVVANAQDANISNDGVLNSVSINNSSSEGPTDDLRIKPDITGNGTSVYSTYDNSDTAYNSITGTSMASPNVTGTLLLLQQHYNNINGNFMRAATLKGLALHTADDIGPSGPDAVHGWGLLNAKKAAETITNNGDQSKIEELTLTNGQSYTITVDSDGTSPLVASISWTDLPGTATTVVNSSTPVLVNDLDIRVSKGSTVYNPYKLTSITTNATGDNTVDPYERIDVANASGMYTITITNKGTLSGGSQNLSLIITGLTGTTTACTATVPTGINSSNIGITSATIGWSAVASATYDLRYRQTGTTSWTTSEESETSKVISGLTTSTAYEVQVRSKCTDGTTSSYSTSANFNTLGDNPNPTAYCASNGKDASYEYINKVVLGSINKTSSAGTGGYSDFTAESTNLSKGSSNTITVTPIWPRTTTYNEGYAVWIDYNQDGDFEDNGEQVWTKTASKTTPVSGSFTVPATAKDGNTRMRVSMKYNGIPSSCESFSYGEVEDYTVVITGGGGSLTMHDLKLSITFDNYPEETSWEIKDSNNQVVHSGGTYGSQTDGSTLVINKALDQGCYTLIFKDVFGDGICCSYGNGSYTLTDSSTGTVLASGGSFTATDTKNFCAGESQTNNINKEIATNSNITKFRNTNLVIYPSPAKSFIMIQMNNSNSASFRIVNQIGQTVRKGMTSEKRVGLNDLPSGLYFISVTTKKETITKRFIKE